MDARHFAAEWQDGWNSHDLNRIMAHYSEDVIFCSRKAIPLTGHGVVHGATALRQYWAQALANQPDLRFTVTEVFEGHNMLVIAYTNHKNIRATETLVFTDGLVTEAAACHATPWA